VRSDREAAVDDEYSLAAVEHWLGVFFERFIATSQFERSAIPNAPKIGAGGSLFPRGDWRSPSDALAIVWLEERRKNVPDPD
jgi:NAD+ synthase (glutamine-hydrolysing)